MKKLLKEDRSLLTYLVLTTLTLGIYGIWFLHHFAKDVNTLCAEDGKRTSGVVAYLLLSVVTLGAYSVFWWFRIGDMLAHAIRRRNLNNSISGGYMIACMLLSFVLCGIAGWVGMHKAFQATNALAEDYNLQFLTKPKTEEAQG